MYFVIVLAILVAYQAINSYAAVAELVDALASGASGGTPVEVQVLSAAPFSISYLMDPIICTFQSCMADEGYSLTKQ